MQAVKPANIHPNNNIRPNNRGVDRHKLAQQQAVPQSDCLWQSCIAHKPCHISLAVSRLQRKHSRFRPHCLQLTQYQRQLPRRSPHVPPLIQLQHAPSAVPTAALPTAASFAAWPGDWYPIAC
jgi:hypothetical protein